MATRVTAKRASSINLTIDVRYGATMQFNLPYVYYVESKTPPEQSKNSPKSPKRGLFRFHFVVFVLVISTGSRSLLPFEVLISSRSRLPAAATSLLKSA